MNLFKQGAPEPDEPDEPGAAEAASASGVSKALKARKIEFFRLCAMFKSTCARKFKWPNFKPSDPNPFHYKVDILFLGLWDTVKSCGWL